MRKALLTIPIGIAIFTVFVVIQSQQSAAEDQAQWQAAVKQAEIDQEQYKMTIVKQIHDEVNRIRTQYNKEPLLWNNGLAVMANDHSQQNTNAIDFKHSDLLRYLSAEGCTWNAGENLAEGDKSTAEETVNGWMNSPKHRENILAPWKYEGIGIALDEYGREYITQAFCV